MSRVWIVSDTHFGHANIIRFCGRPFASVEEMDAVMVAQWNECVRPNDTVWHLGDVAFHYDEAELYRLLQSLHGRKHLILGNHDDPTSRSLQHGFETINAWRQVASRGVILSHFPLHPSCLNKYQDGVAIGVRNIHGHIHEKLVHDGARLDQQYINASVEHTGYAPILLDELVARKN